jgi:hypothetical protein
MEAHLAARIAAGYVHPDDRPTKLEQEEIERIEREHEEDEARLALAALWFTIPTTSLVPVS